MSEIKNVIIVFFIVFIFIQLVSNNKVIDFVNTEKIPILKKNKKVILKILLIILVLWIIIDNSIQIKTNLEYYFEDNYTFEQIILESKEKIQKENDFYNQIILDEFSIENCKNPYIPENFEYVEGEWNTGFVVQDEKQNQYVWIPCININNNQNIEVLKNRKFSSNDFIKHFDCYENNYEEFLYSALTNGGFYISRFEIGKDNHGNAVSKAGYEVFNNITKKEAIEISKNMQENINSELINGYAYDTVLYWIINSEESETVFRKTEKFITGVKAYKNIYDILDNVYEFSTEVYYGEIIYRGVIPENKYILNDNLDNRLSCDEEYFSENIGFRTILYK